MTPLTELEQRDMAGVFLFFKVLDIEHANKVLTDDYRVSIGFAVHPVLGDKRILSG